MLAHLGDGALVKLLAVINQSFRIQRLPGQWKTTPHVPVPKSIPGEYRPIALLSCIDKIMEKMILARLKHLIGPLHDNLMGCTEGRGTADAIATVVSIASDARHNRSGLKTLKRKSCYSVFIDYEKAFELADPSSILHLLTTDKGIKGNLLGWLQDFLTDRRGFTIVQGASSDVLPLHQGTPQGSVLSPYLFNILVDKLLSTLENSLGPDLASKITVLSYADDLVLISNHSLAPAVLTKALQLLESISTILGLQINIGKTKAMAWEHSHSFPCFYFEVYNTQIEWVRTYKYLGVVLDDTLSFMEHSKAICNRANKRLNILKYMAGSPFGATQETLLHYYKSCIRPILEYGSIVMPIACPSAIRKLESLQNISLRIAMRLPLSARTTFMLTETGCPPLDDRMKGLAMVTLSKILASGNTHPYCLYNRYMHMDPDLLGKHYKRKRHLPLDISLHQTAKQANIPKLKSHTPVARHPSNPPLSSCFSYDIQPLYKSKSSFTPSELQELAKTIVEYIDTTFPTFLNCYVDGSVDNNTGHSASAFISHNPECTAEKAIRVSDHVSSTQAELAAIHEVLVHINNYSNTTPSQVVIHCDSMSAIQALKKTKIDPFNLQVQEILDLAHTLSNSQAIRITLHWIPSHIGIPGNEAVDTLVKTALQHSTVDKHLPVTLGQIKATVQRHLIHRNGHHFINAAENSTKPITAAKYKVYLKINPTLMKQQNLTNVPAAQRTLNRLRLATDTWCYQHDHHFSCSYCSLPYTPEHYLMECPVTHSVDMLQLLSQEELQNGSSEQYILIIKRLSTEKYFLKHQNKLAKHPISVFCSSPDHGQVAATWISLPKGI
jgi:ribonuclease HI